VEHHGSDAGLAAFQRYLDPGFNDIIDFQFLSPEGFASKYAMWCKLDDDTDEAA